MLAASGPNLPKSILVIEDDDSINAFIIDSLSGIQDTIVKGLADGNAAWEESQQHHYDLIILDWKVPSINGLTLFNRFRQDPNYQDVPILVISGFLNAKDFTLLEEFPLSGKLEKPFKPQTLLMKISQLNEECLWYRQKKDAITQLFQNPDPQKGEDYLKAILELESKAPNPFKLCLVTGRALRSLGFFKEAEILLLRALKYNNKSLVIMNELGKLYLQTRRNKEAKRILEKAMDLSPDNIDRICQLGSLSLQECDTKAAHDYFEKASELDPGNKIAQSGLKLTKSIEEYLTSSATPGQSYAALLNAIGVSMVRNQDFAQGIEHYQSALDHIFDDETKARLSFNLGLGFKKWHRQHDAVTWFKKSLDLDPSFDRALEQLHQIGLDGRPAATTAPSTSTAPEAAAVSTTAPNPPAAADAPLTSLEGPAVPDPDVEEIYEGPMLDFPEPGDEPVAPAATAVASPHPPPAVSAAPGVSPKPGSLKLAPQTQAAPTATGSENPPAAKKRAAAGDPIPAPAAAATAQVTPAVEPTAESFKAYKR